MFLNKKLVVISILAIIGITSIVMALNTLRASYTSLNNKAKQYNTELLEMIN